MNSAVAWAEVMPLRVTTLGAGTSSTGSRACAPYDILEPFATRITNVVCEGFHGVIQDSTGKQPRTTSGSGRRGGDLVATQG